MSDIKFPSITARFYVAEVNKRPRAGAQVVLLPAYANGANHDWSTATPSGRIEMYVSNPDALAAFDRALNLPQDECLEITFDVVKSQPKAVASFVDDEPHVAG